LDYLTTDTRLSPIRRGFAPGFVNYKIGCTQLAAANDKVYQLLAHDWWFSPGTKASATTNTGRHDIAQILLKVALNTINQIEGKIRDRKSKDKQYNCQKKKKYTKTVDFGNVYLEKENNSLIFFPFWFKLCH